MLSASRKRKLSDEKEKEVKYYAVRAGKEPGVYMTWAECQENITGFKGASYKSFTTQKDAEDFCAGKIVTGPSASKKPETDKYYGVAVGKKIGVYREWSEVQEQIKDVKGPRYKKFPTYAEAEAFVRLGGPKGVVSPSTGRKDAGDVRPAAKKAKITQITAQRGKGKFIRVWTDGSSLSNGRSSARAGVGVYFGRDDPRNVSERLSGLPQTNNRAELTAILRAIQRVPIDTSMEILTDSNYSINCLTVWYSSWKKKQWKTSTGKDVENQDLIKHIRELIDRRIGVETNLTWIKGHDGHEGNEAADRLAVAGSRMADVEVEGEVRRLAVEGMMKN